MSVILRWTRLLLSFGFFVLSLVVLSHYDTGIYLLYQAKGQLAVLNATQSVGDYAAEKQLTEREKSNLELVEKIKRYSVDSLGYLPTSNYTRIFDQRKQSTLWVITACEPYSFNAYNWEFPVVGGVSYKGFFEKELAEKEYHHLRAMNYDVDLRSVSAWSTLGWFSDPILSGMLVRSRAGMANLLFHELFHATYYAPGSVDLNENLANFIADKATLRFFKNDTAGIRTWLNHQTDQQVFSNYMLQKKKFLEQYYITIAKKSNCLELKLRAIRHIADSIRYLPLHYPDRYTDRASEIMGAKNAFFIDFQQYESLQDSLEKVFNKFYGGSVKIFIEHLKLNKINY